MKTSKGSKQAKDLYPRIVEVSLIVALIVVIAAFQVSKRIDRQVDIREPELATLEVEQIPITRQFKRPQQPERPTIPVEDPDIPLEADIEFTDPTDWDKLPDPPQLKPAGLEPVDFIFVEEKPVLIGGTAALYAFLRDHELYPKMAREASIEGTAIIGFTVGVDGIPHEVHVLQERPEGLGFGEAAMQAIEAMRFEPGMQRDRAVPVKMRQAIKFRISN